MKKLLRFVDNHLLQILIGFLIIFIPLYPKLPSIHIEKTWVYIRLEDFFIAFAALFWIIQLLRKKVHIPFELGIPFALYWIAGFASLLVSVIFIGPTLALFYPHVAIFQYVRRLEYLVLFFIAFSTIKSIRDLKFYLTASGIAIFGTVLYGIGQRGYLNLWTAFPKFFEKYPFCFPSFQTGNEEFAKGIPLCLPSDARITSTFAGHYDLAAYLVFTIPILAVLLVSFKNWYLRIGTFILFSGSVMLLIFTASRVSFVAYIIGLITALIFSQKKKFILPGIIISLVLLLTFSGSTAKRFLDTIRITSIVTNNQGQVVGETVSSLPKDLQKKISKNPVVLEAPPPTQNLPTGSSFIALPQTKTLVATTAAVVKSQIAEAQAKKLKLKYGGVEISTISGTFLIQKALVYDISFTTRFQAEWPTAWYAFLKDPPFGSGYSTITLATDGDYLRFLGESGFLGLTTFLSIFLILGITLYAFRNELNAHVVEKGFLFGIAGGVVGLLVNALFIDVFEASKVAENLWIFLGIAAGFLLLHKKEKIPYVRYLKAVFFSNTFIFFYLLIISMIAFIPSINNFFVGDDFTWLRWAASSDISNLPKYFMDAHGFFYRPIPKIIMFFLYTLFSFQPPGYHLFGLFVHLLVGFGVFLICYRLLKSKLWAFLAALIFILLPVHSENVFWISALSINLSTLFIVYGLFFYIRFRQDKSVINYIASIIAVIFALFSYEMSVVFPLLMFSYDLIIKQTKNWRRTIIFYIPFVALVPLYLFIRAKAGTVAAGGDYSYNISHLLANIVGNLGGYLGMYVVGEPFIPFYTVLRESLRSSWVLISILLIVILVILVGIGIFLKRKIILWYKPSDVAKLFLFSILFLIITLLPFLGLGNISERYGYLSSVGYAFLLVIVVRLLLMRLAPDIRVRKALIVALAVIIGFVYLYQLNIQKKSWGKAGTITQNALAALRINFPEIPQYSNFYFVNVPIKKAQAWIFPVGLEDGIWFIYRDPTIRIYKLGTLTQADAMSAESQVKTLQKNYIFIFDNEGVIESK